ncbi:6-carboxytetrahydropterin synthase [Halorubrum ezzemoulense]|jgi:6-pyruvoyltetrahydropterin/6-carboxytetrahydropterin synthase|uniref:6-carboxytetrahydropterin synthase n=2 Tax=Halorubrum ezzemoulense TaxID=337243 RepID=A0A256IUK0_HALEZ|nr:MULTISPECIES: 6-carboxytetrahydropterin synthase [Halorubrum]MDB2224934.1 6-carboxytetrahydropterin synthase [Halorubrum ezzemoulense]MDB2237191.1 6-carboxytetrahydropterin synthase [Halorubrum ezzemoulense]MDB2241668.1 6-carboxytetrahydropterin synthase [Halorubrum ezzemoulense]MDB2245511.1 6-carboxytetrahydropterin synthase [Halorubrum ezzemoulense]MDB2246859.1 6-carboxytetrahydropterin synthase [Halorubrum ezzemoulense]
MYELTVTESFVAQHYLTVPNPPADEAALHSHVFTAEATFRGPELGEYGYLLDIDLALDALSDAAERYRDETLNDHLEGNPSAERLARALFDALATVDAPAATELTVTVREDDVASVSFTGDLR